MTLNDNITNYSIINSVNWLNLTVKFFVRNIQIPMNLFQFYQQQLINLVYRAFRGSDAEWEYADSISINSNSLTRCTVRFGEVMQSGNMQIPFLSTATHKLGVACVSVKCRKKKKDCLFPRTVYNAFFLIYHVKLDHRGIRNFSCWGIV